MKLTADTITDVQIRELHDSGVINYALARAALDEPYGSAASAWATYTEARIDCAELFNARNERSCREQSTGGMQMKIFGKGGVFASTGSAAASGSATGGSAPDSMATVPAAEKSPTLEELKAQLCLVAQGLKKLYGNRTAVIIAIGLPNGDHDRFAAYTTGPCLMERGLLHWAVPNLVQQMDAHVTEGDKP